jgi:hypothetical protein
MEDPLVAEEGQQPKNDKEEQNKKEETLLFHLQTTVSQETHKPIIANLALQSYPLPLNFPNPIPKCLKFPGLAILNLFQDLTKLDPWVRC